jgi:hypothetical protein
VTAGQIGRCTIIPFALFAFVTSCPLATADTVIPHTDRGWYDNTGFHNPGNPNYVVGDTGVGVVRNFFVFDLSSVVQPIASAKLALFVPSESAGPGYNSPDASENYELHDVATPLATLLGGTGGVAAHTDLGSGVVYGSRTMTATDMGTIVEITLNPAAIAALDAATGFIAIGGSLTTLDGVSNSEFTFGSSGSVADITELRITLVPEPSSAVLFSVASLALIRRGRRRVG